MSSNPRTVTPDDITYRYDDVVEWSDPWPGVDVRGKEVTVTVLQRATVESVLNIARLNDLQQRPRQLVPTPPEMLLDQFLVVNWAIVYRNNVPVRKDTPAPAPVDSGDSGEGDES